jgi:hypothetical protein
VRTVNVVHTGAFNSASGPLVGPQDFCAANSKDSHFGKI